MNYKFYIQSLNGFPLDDWACSAYLALRGRAAEIYLYEDIEEVPKQHNIILIACIEDTLRYLEKLGIPAPAPLNIPKCLRKYAQRDIEVMTMREYLEDDRDNTFVKPESRAKEFVAGVVKKATSKPYYFQDVNPDTKVMVSEVIELLTEYRGYVIDNELVGIKHYTGDFKQFLNVRVVEEAIQTYKSFGKPPAGYSIDFGVDKYGRTVLIELNDGFALGNYGLSNGLYTNLLCKRWIELTTKQFSL